MKEAIIIFAVTVFVLITSWCYIIYFADDVAMYTGYFTSVGVFPFLYGITFGHVALISMQIYSGFPSAYQILILIVIGMVALIPTLIFYIGMSLPHVS